MLKTKTVYFLISALMINVLTISCSPTAYDANPTSIDNYTTGKTVTISPSNKNENPKKVQYVNSGNKKVFEKVKEVSVSHTSGNSSEKQSNLALRASIKTASLIFYNQEGQIVNELNGSKVVLIIETVNKNKSTFHKYITNENNLNNLTGSTSLEKDVSFNKQGRYASVINANIKCLDKGICKKALIELVIKKDKVISEQTREFDITASIGISRKSAKVIIKKNPKDNDSTSSALKDIVEETNSDETKEVLKVDIVVSDGVSYSDINIDDKVTMSIPVTDPRETDAQVSNDKVSVEGTEVTDVVFQGVATYSGSIVVDITSNQKTNNQDAITDQDPDNDTTTEQDTDKDTTSTEDQSSTPQQITDRVIILTEEDEPLILDGQISHNFNLTQMKDLIELGEATWGDVGVNPKTSLFFKDIQDETLLKSVLTQEAEFEALRHNPKVETQINKYKDQTCKYFIKNMAPARTIVAEAYLKSGLSPNFAANMRLESLYGIGSSKSNIYDPLVVGGCHTASGPFQINSGTYKAVLKRAHIPSSESGYVGELINEHDFSFIHRKAKVGFNPEGDGSASNPYFPTKNCEEINENIYVDDHRMFLEPSAIIASSFMAFNYSRYKHDAPLGFASYKQGPYRYYYRHGETRFKGLSLVEIDHFNMSAAGIGEKMQAKYNDGIDYAYKAIAIRSILTQPENYCNLNVDSQSYSDILIDFYYDSVELLKSEEKQKEMNLFHPSGKILSHSKEITQ